MRLMHDFVACQDTQASNTSKTGFLLFRNGPAASTRRCSEFIIGVVQPVALRTAMAVIDFNYYSQLQVHTSKSLKSLQKALEAFHKSKNMFVIEGIWEHFNIPKIHAMIHYYAAIQSCGSLDGFNTKSPEQLHIDYVKEVYHASNKKEYVGQMTVWLGRQEAVA